MEVSAFPNPLDEFVGQRLACLEVESEGVEELWLDGKVFHYLRGKFHKVALHISAAKRFVMHLREDAVESVTELVQEGLDLA